MSREELLKKLESYLADKSKILVRIHYGTLRALYLYLQSHPDVVRCKDCRFWDNGLCGNDNVSRQIDDCGCYPNFITSDDWYCADGERKDGEKLED